LPFSNAYHRAVGTSTCLLVPAALPCRRGGNGTNGRPTARLEERYRRLQRLSRANRRWRCRLDVVLGTAATRAAFGRRATAAAQRTTHAAALRALRGTAALCSATLALPVSTTPKHGFSSMACFLHLSMYACLMSLLPAALCRLYTDSAFACTAFSFYLYPYYINTRMPFPQRPLRMQQFACFYAAPARMGATASRKHICSAATSFLLRARYAYPGTRWTSAAFVVSR